MTRRVSPPLRSFERRTLQGDVRHYADGLGFSCPTKALGKEPREDGHEDNKAFVARWRAEQTKRKEEEPMSAAAANAIIAHVDERFDRYEQIAAMRAETMDRVRETVDRLATRFPDDERIQDGVAEFLEEEDTGA
jgi:hypothetical protein